MTQIFSRFRPAAMACVAMLLVATLLPRGAAAQDARTITFDEAVRIALDQNIAIKRVANNLDAQAAQVTAERGDFYPNLNVNLTAEQKFGTNFDQTSARFLNEQTQSVFGSASSSINLFNGFADVASLKQAQHTMEQFDYAQDRARQTVVFNVVSNYLDVVSNRELIRIREENLAAQKQQLAQIEEFTRVGTRPISDLYQQQAAVAQAEAQLLEAERLHQLSQTRVIQVLQLDPFGNYTFAAPQVEDIPMTAEAYDLTNLLRNAFDRRADLKSDEMRIAAARQGIRVARSGYLPTVGLTGTVNGNYLSTTEDALGIGFASQLFDDLRSESVRLSVSVPLFNRFDVRNQVQQAEVQYENARLDLEENRHNVALQVRQAYLDFQVAEKQLDVTEKQLQAAQQALEAEQERYNIGAGTLVELSQARASYVQAQSDRADALYSFLFRKKLIDYYVGVLDPAKSLFE